MSAGPCPSLALGAPTFLAGPSVSGQKHATELRKDPCSSRCAGQPRHPARTCAADPTAGAAEPTAGAAPAAPPAPTISPPRHHGRDL